MTAELHPQQLAARLRRVALQTALKIAVPPRFYPVRDAALGTASYEALIRSRGPMGLLTREQHQAAILVAALRLGFAAKTADGRFVVAGAL